MIQVKTSWNSSLFNIFGLNKIIYKKFKFGLAIWMKCGILNESSSDRDVNSTACKTGDEKIEIPG